MPTGRKKQGVKYDQIKFDPLHIPRNPAKRQVHVNTPLTRVLTKTIEMICRRRSYGIFAFVVIEDKNIHI
jgi:hypothetical protein